MRKNRFLTAFAAAFLVTGVSAAASAEQAVVTGSEVNVRTGPGTSYTIFASLGRDKTVEVVSRADPDWYLVSWDGSSGYVSSQFLKLSEADSAAEVTVGRSEETPGYINGMYVCLRSGPSTSSSIIGTYSTGKLLVITGTSGEWTAVRIDGQDGYVFSQFVEEGRPEAAVVVTDGSDADGPAVFSASAGDQPLVVQSGSTLFTVRESPSPAPEEVLSPEHIVQVPTDGASHDGPSVYPVLTAPDQTAEAADDAPALSGAAAKEAEPAPDVSAEAPGESSPEPVPEPVPEAAASPASEPEAVRLGRITGNVVRLRSGPGTTYSIIGTYDSGTEVVIAGVSGEWTAVTVPASGVSGYIHSDYILAAATEDIASDETGGAAPAAPSAPDPASFTPADGYITGSSVRLREAPSMSARILDELNFGTAVRMTGLSDDWFRVIVNGKEGYVSASFVKEGRFEPATQLSHATGTELGKEIAAYALQYVGTPYKWGGNTPETGFDCSGFVQYVYGQFGYATSRVANDALADGVHVDPADLQPGDMLCFYSGSNYVGHLGIYIGDNLFVHAANSATGVVTTSLETGYYATRGYEIRRIG